MTPSSPPFSAGTGNAGNRGGTLVELAMVLVVIGLLMTLVLPLFARVGDADLRAAGRRLAGTVKYLYNEAALEKCLYRLTFDLDHATYRADRQLPGGEWRPLPGRGGQTRLPDAVAIAAMVVKGRGTFTSGSVSLRIYPMGWLDEAVLHLRQGGYRQTLRLAPLTGTTEFYDGHREFQ
ncbi:MAG: hypothetical protein AB1568_05130 [Thermodesulfobacteriota bacterium]